MMQTLTALFSRYFVTLVLLWNCSQIFLKWWGFMVKMEEKQENMTIFVNSSLYLEQKYKKYFFSKSSKFLRVFLWKNASFTQKFFHSYNQNCNSYVVLVKCFTNFLCTCKLLTVSLTTSKIQGFEIYMVFFWKLHTL